MLFRIFKGLNILIDSRYYSYFGVVVFFLIIIIALFSNSLVA